MRIVLRGHGLAFEIEERMLVVDLFAEDKATWELVSRRMMNVGHYKVDSIGENERWTVFVFGSAGKVYGKRNWNFWVRKLS